MRFLSSKFLSNDKTSTSSKSGFSKLLDKVKELLPNHEFVHSSKLGLKNEEMAKIYSECFIGLRLCPQDGNANTVQEFQFLKIPIIHNCSKYGMKWKNEKDIIKTILKIYSS